MYIHINNCVAKIAKGFTQRREKKPDDTEAVIGHLKFSGCLIDRETIDEICGMPLGWSQGALFDEFGAPFVWGNLDHWRFECDLTGTITGIKPTESLTIANAKLSNIVLAFDKMGAQLSGEIAWEIAGDESQELVPLQGNECRVVWVLQDSGQQDLVKQAQKAA